MKGKGGKDKRLGSGRKENTGTPQWSGGGKGKVLATLAQSDRTASKERCRKKGRKSEKRESWIDEYTGKYRETEADWILLIETF